MSEEIELKILLDAAGEKAVRRRLAELADPAARPRNVSLHAVYFDTEDGALARAKITLRVRKEGRRWVQAVKRGTGMVGGLSRPEEWEGPARGGRLDLEAFEAPAREAVRAAADGRALLPQFETRMRRTLARLAAPEGGEVEVAIDVGEIVAGGRRAQLRELELELKSGEPRDLYALALALAPGGPPRFSRRNKAQRGAALAAGGEAAAPAPPVVRAASVEIGAAADWEAAALAALRSCFDQIAANAAAAAAGDDPDAAHQFRIGLRRLRTVARVFAPAVGGLDALAEEARDLAAVAGAARELDVLSAMLEAARIEDDPGAAALAGALAEARREAWDGLHTRLAETGARFVFALGGFIEGRGWRRPGADGQAAALARPARDDAADALDRLWRRARKRARRLKDGGEEARHELRKALKSLRYAGEAFESLFEGKAQARFLKRLKKLQESFGGLQDAASVRALLLAPDAPGAGDPAAVRVTGRLLGRLEIRAEAERPDAEKAWRRLADARPYWR